MQKFWIFILISFWYNIGDTQPYRIIEIGSKNGVPELPYNSLYVDSKGFVWTISTGFGAVRYNGEKLFAFNKLMYNPDAVSIYIDLFDTVLIGTFSGIEVIYYDTVLYHIDLQKQYDCGPIRAITKCKDGTVWAASNKGIFFKIRNKKAKKIELPQPYNHITDINSIVCDSAGNIWIASYTGYLVVYNPKSHKIENIKQELNLKYDEYTEIIPIKDGMLVTTNDSSLLIQSKKLINKYYTLYYGYDKEYLAGVGDSFVVAKIDNGKETILKTFTFDIPQLNDVWFSDVLYTNNLFFLTSSKGFFEITPDIKIYDNKIIDADIIKTKIITFFEGKIWVVGLPFGYFENDKFYHSTFIDSLPIDFRADNVFHTYNKVYFSSTSGKGFYYIDTKTNNIYYDAFLDKLRRTDPTTGICGNRKITFIASQGNIIVINNNTKDTSYYHINSQNQIVPASQFDSSISNYPYVKKLFADSHSTIWIATMKGLWYYKNNKFYNIPDTLFNADFHDVLEDDKGNIWISSSKGIINYSYTKDKFRLISGDFHSINFKRFVKLLYTPNNLYVNFRKYNIKDDYLVYEGHILGDSHFRGISNFNFYDCAIDSNGNFWFPSSNKIYSIPLVKINLKKSLPRILFTKAVIQANSHIKKIYLSNNDTLYLSPQDDNVSFYFDILAFNTSNYQVFYRLFPDNKNWTKTTFKQVTYNSLKSGTYIFELKASNSSRYFSQAKIVVIKKPFFYEMLWFKVLIGLLIVIFIYVLLRINTALVKKKEAYKRAISQQIAELQIKALQAQMNPHFIFNTLNSIQYLLAFDKMTQAYEAIDIFSKLIRKTLEFISINFISIEEETEYLKLYLEIEKLRFEDQFEYKIEHENIKDFTTSVLPPLIIQPFVENAIKHGLLSSNKPIKKLIITFTQTLEEIIITVEDNGKGFDLEVSDKPKERQHGIEIVKEKLEIYTVKYKKKYDLKIKSISDKGATIIITIPL